VFPRLKLTLFALAKPPWKVPTSSAGTESHSSFVTPSKKRKSPLPPDSGVSDFQTDLSKVFEKGSESPDKRQKGVRKFGNNNLEVRLMKNWCKLDTGTLVLVRMSYLLCEKQKKIVKSEISK
jgi:hypothetical protein